jgi:hypothetical protein
MMERRCPAKIGRDDRFHVVAHLEGDDRLDVQADALPRHAGFLHLGFGHGQRQQIRPPNERHNEGAVPDDHPERCPVARLSTGNE